jgi:uncharacterized repeat protein (TIGR02543 family)
MRNERRWNGWAGLSLSATALVLLAGLAACGRQADVEEASLSSAATSPITIWIAGDSTVANGSSPCPIGWGGQFQSYFSSQAKVVNSAVGGRSVRTWLYEVTTTMDSTGECVLTLDSSGQPALQTRWQAMLDGMKSGDYLFIQFGINDGSATCDRHVGLNAFKASYGMMAQAAKQRGANPIFVTPLSAISCSGSTAQPTRGSYVTATFEAGSQYGVPVIDLHALSIAYYNSQHFCPLPNGATDVSSTTGGAVGAFFCDDHTHLETSGAVTIAGLVAKAIKDQGIGLASYLAGATPSYALTVNSSGNGSTNPAAGTYSYTSGAQVTVTATPASGYVFTGWSGAASGTSNPVTITVDGDKTLTANFAAQTYTLTLSASGSGSTSPAAGVYSYTAGTSVVVSATPFSGYVFTGWSGAASGTSNPVTLSMNGNKTLTANFAVQSYTLTLSASGMGSTSPAAGVYSYTAGTTVVVSATPFSGYAFTGWSGAASGTSNPVTIAMDGSKTLTANFGVAPDTTPPSAPGSLSWENADGTVTLSWQPSTDAVGVTGYELYYGSFYLGTFDETLLALIGFKPGTPYVFTVKAHDGAGNVSGASNQATVLVPMGKDTTPPSTPNNLKATSVTSTSVSLSWTASSDDVGVVVYQVYQGQTLARTVTSASATITGLTPSTSYTFGVQAFDAAGNASGLGGPLAVTTSAATAF